jgi:hypothetical protein
MLISSSFVNSDNSLQIALSVSLKLCPMQIRRFVSVLAICCMMSAQLAHAQTDIGVEVLENVKQYFRTQNPSAQGLSDFRVSDVYTDRQTGLTHVYVQQMHGGIPVFNAISVLAVREGRVVHGRPSYIMDIAGRANGTAPAVTAEDAIAASLQHLGRQAIPDLTAMPNNVHGHLRFSAPELAASPVEVHLVYVSVDGMVRLAWNVSIEMKDEPHWWNIRMDAQTGVFLEKNDYTVSCSFGQAEQCDHSHHRHISNTHAAAVQAPAPPLPPSSVYNIFPLPIEAPTFGPRSLIYEPADPVSSPFGWHDVDGVDGAEYTITRGNNVYAYEDANNVNLPGYSPSGGAGLTFDFAFTPDLAPSVNMDAALTNMFYQTNVVHDYLYHLGFDEQAGNFQQNNYGNGGLGEDYVLGEGFDGSGTNNANFSTPPDGSAPRMQMYLWNSVPEACQAVSIVSDGFTGDMQVSRADFAGIGNVTAELVLADDGANPNSNACSDLINDVIGKVVLIDRGGCTFISKAQRAQTAGAAAVIIVNNLPGGGVSGMTGTPALSIPVVMVSYEDGEMLKAALIAGEVEATVRGCETEAFDSNFDNGILVHEYGHGLSNRLTGGPSQASCLANAEQGGEGWSDWLALMLTINNGDDGTEAKGVGTYVLNQSPNGSGIRRYPYSTDMGINPLTYGHLATSDGNHAKGEIWCAAIWDMSWLLMGAYGYDSDPLQAAVGNNIAIKLVIEGMKLQPCSPGYLDARDAILAADDLLYDNAHRDLIWQAFARRGMGCSADQGSANSSTDQTEAFDAPATYYRDQDEDGLGDPDDAQFACTQPVGHVTNANDCDDSNASIGACVLWTGAVDSLWSNAGNWRWSAVPTASDNVVIATGYDRAPVVNNIPSAPAVCSGLVVGAGADLTVEAGAALTVNGTLTNAGNLRVKANENGIGSLITNGSITGAGTFQVEQYLLGAGGATPSGVFQYVSSPVIGATSAAYDAAGTNKLWSANESTQGYPPIADNITSLNIGAGYVARVGANGVHTLSGTSFHTGNIAIPSLTRSGSGGNYGYNLIGNPFPSSVNWTDAVRINVETTLWYRTHSAGGVMMVETFNASGGIGTNTGNYTGQSAVGIIPSGQAFWVRVVEGQPEGIVAFFNGSRSHGTQASIYKQEAEEGTIRLHLSNGSISDETIVHFTTDAADSYDDFDSQKMWMNNLPQLYTSVGADSLTINGLYSIETNPIVDLGIKAPTMGNYTITASSITLTEEVWLEDRLLNNFQHLNLNPVYAFTTDAGNIGDRFALHFGELVTSIGREAMHGVSTWVYAFDNTVNITVGEDITSGMVTIMDMTGRTVHTAALTGTRTAIGMYAAKGIYLVRVETANGVETKRVPIN